MPFYIFKPTSCWQVGLVYVVSGGNEEMQQSKVLYFHLCPSCLDHFFHLINKKIVERNNFFPCQLCLFIIKKQLDNVKHVSVISKQKLAFLQHCSFHSWCLKMRQNPGIESAVIKSVMYLFTGNLFIKSNKEINEHLVKSIWVLYVPPANITHSHFADKLPPFSLSLLQ